MATGVTLPAPCQPFPLTLGSLKDGKARGTLASQGLFPLPFSHLMGSDFLPAGFRDAKTNWSNVSSTPGPFDVVVAENFTKAILVTIAHWLFLTGWGACCPTNPQL